MPEINITLHDMFIEKYHDLFYDILDNGHTHYTLYGGRGSTKSSFISCMIPLIMLSYPNVHAAVFRKVGNTLKSTVYGQMQWGIDQVGLGEYFRMKVNPMEMIFLPTGQKIMFFGLDDPRKIKSIKLPFGYVGITFFEECDQYSGEEEIRTVLQSTMRGGNKFWDFRAFNPPISSANWVNQDVLLPKPKTIAVKSSYLDVPQDWLGEEFFNEAEFLKETNPRAYQHEYLGEPIGDGGNVFENVKIRKIPDEDIDRFDRIYMGVDFGWYPDPFVWVKMHFDAARRILYVFDEYVTRKESNASVWRTLQSKKGVCGADLITADSAEPKSIADFRSYGSNMRGAEKGRDSVEYSIKWLQALSAIVIDPVRCPNAAKEFITYEYERDKDNNIVNAYPDRDNHVIDGIRYGMERIWKRKGL